MINVLITVESRFIVNRKKLRSYVSQFLSSKVHRNAQVSIAVAGDRKMRKLNKEFRNIDATTNVLSFPLHETKHMTNSAGKSISFTNTHISPDSVLRLGDVVVSYPRAVDEARQQNKLVDDRIAELVEHGLKHLLGIHHY